MGEKAGHKYDGGKPLMGLLYVDCNSALMDIVNVLTFGAHKYEPRGWKTVENAKERYMDALYRHLAAHHRGELVDAESNLTHLAHAACNLIFLLELEKECSSESTT